MSKTLINLILIASIIGLPAPNVAQESAQPPAAATPDDKLATVRGKLIVPEKWTATVRPDELDMKLSEKLTMEEPPLPDGWNELAPEKQVEWWEGFQASGAGQQFLAAQQLRFNNRRILNAVVESDGSFAVFDVPAATWDFRAEIRRKLPDNDVIFEVFGELTVKAEVDEVVLGEMEVEATPVFQAGDALPAVTWNSAAGELKLQGHDGKHLLVTFWNAAQLPSASFQKAVEAAVTEIGAKHPVELISIGLDQDEEAAAKFYAENAPVGLSASAAWDDEATALLGVRSIPWLLLADPQGKVLMSDQELGFALRTSGLPLVEIIQRKIEGLEIPVAATPTETGGDGG